MVSLPALLAEAPHIPYKLQLSLESCDFTPHPQPSSVIWRGGMDADMSAAAWKHLDFHCSDAVSCEEWRSEFSTRRWLPFGCSRWTWFLLGCMSVWIASIMRAGCHAEVQASLNTERAQGGGGGGESKRDYKVKDETIDGNSYLWRGCIVLRTSSNTQQHHEKNEYLIQVSSASMSVVHLLIVRFGSEAGETSKNLQRAEINITKYQYSLFLSLSSLFYNRGEKNVKNYYFLCCGHTWHVMRYKKVLKVFLAFGVHIGLSLPNINAGLPRTVGKGLVKNVVAVQI